MLFGVYYPVLNEDIQKGFGGSPMLESALRIVFGIVEEGEKKNALSLRIVRRYHTRKSTAPKDEVFVDF